MAEKKTKSKKGKVAESASLPPIEDILKAEQEKIRLASNTPVVIHAQYIKDLSFENPNAPGVFSDAGKPVMDANFSMDAKKLDVKEHENLYEVSLGIHVVAKRADVVAFIAEIEYGVMVSLGDVPEAQHHPLLLIEMPKYAFPFVRQIVANLTQQAGYMPLLLSPVNFKNFYMQQFGKKIQEDAVATGAAKA